MLHDVGPVFSGIFFFLTQEVISQEKVDREAAAEMLQFSNLGLTWHLISLSLLHWVTLLPGIKSVQYVDNASTLVRWDSQTALSIITKF